MLSSVISEKKRQNFVIFAKNLIRGCFRMPAISFERKLFIDLISESARKHGVQDIRPPEVEFEEGPINLTLGTFNFKSKLIIIDILETFLVSVFSSPKNQEELEKLYDDKLTDVLAHEAGHWVLDSVKGEEAVREIRYMYLIYLTLFMIPCFFTSWGLFNLFSGFVGSLFANGALSGIVLGLPVAAIGIALFALIAVINLVLAGIASRMVTYQKCEHERFAREYAEEIKDDPRWKDVITFRR